MNRRHFIALLGTTALAGCANVGNTITLSASVINDVGLIASGLSGSLGALTGLSIFTEVSGYVSVITATANQITSSMSQSAAQSDVGTIETAINDILSVAAGLPLPPPFGPALTAASILLPLIEDAVGLAVSATARTAAARAQAASMTPDEARNILINAAQGH